MLEKRRKRCVSRLSFIFVGNEQKKRDREAKPVSNYYLSKTCIFLSGFKWIVVVLRMKQMELRRENGIKEQVQRFRQWVISSGALRLTSDFHLWLWLYGCVL